MGIEFLNNKFHIFNNDISYVIEVSEQNDLLHLHFGASVEANNLFHQKNINTEFTSYSDEENPKYSLSALPQEYPSGGASDFRAPAYQILTKDGCHTPELKFKSYEIINGKPKLEGLPAVYTENDNEAQTLIILTEDINYGLQVKLYYTIINGYNAICRHSEIINNSYSPIHLKNAQSFSLDFPAGNYEYIHLEGAWAREKHIERNAVHKGSQGFESRRGASGHIENPFLLFFEQGATEDYGNAYGISLIYSGNHKFLMEREYNETVRVQAGINPFEFDFKLEHGQTFTTPEVVIAFSENGFSKISHTFHKLYRTHLCRGYWRDKARPILINNWEATYADFTKNDLIKIADAASNLGLELFVLDDGWFGERNDDTTSLGDWFANEKKLNGPLSDLVSEINKRGLKFGLWFEPEMISLKSELYKAHPDWLIKTPYSKEHYGRHQCILDLTKPEVRGYIVNILSNILSNANIEYVKWDMNRNMTDAYSSSLPADRQGEFYHRYILGLYEILETLTQKFPKVLFEGCSGGGGRNDPGMLYYMPQNWTSDDTDATERLFIQYGSSLVYPASTMACHVSAVPNHQIKRSSPLSMRGNVAMSGAFGYELDLSKLSSEEIDEVKNQVEFYKNNRDIIMNGTFYRLLNPFVSRHAAWSYVTEDEKTALVYYIVKQARPTNEAVYLKLKGLNSNYNYEINGTVYSGKTLMNYGYLIEDNEYEGMSFILKLNAVN